MAMVLRISKLLGDVHFTCAQGSSEVQLLAARISPDWKARCALTVSGLFPHGLEQEISALSI